MTIGYPAIAGTAKGNYYDRTLLPLKAVYSNVIAPAADTQRWTYTVPTARLAIVSLLHVMLERVTAAGAVGESQGYIAYTPTGGALSAIVVVNIINNAVGAGDSRALSPSFAMIAGDILEGHTSDVSTTGTVRFHLAAAVDEFAI